MKHNVICHVTKVKPATSAHSMADVIPFSVYSTFALNRTLRYNQKKIYFIHNKEKNIRNIFRTFMFQQLLKNEHHRLRDSVPITIWPSGGLCLVTDKKKNNKSRVKQEPRSAHGRAVNKSRAEQEPRSAHGRAVNNKSRVKQEPRSAHGRAVNKTPYRFTADCRQNPLLNL